MLCVLVLFFIRMVVVMLNVSKTFLASPISKTGLPGNRSYLSYRTKAYPTCIYAGISMEIFPCALTSRNPRYGWHGDPNSAKERTRQRKNRKIYDTMQSPFYNILELVLIYVCIMKYITSKLFWTISRWVKISFNMEVGGVLKVTTWWYFECYPTGHKFKP